jgi:membrane protease YdiL (CAAX protease family)
MTRQTSRVQSYFHHTHSLLYSYLISLPLLLMYELLIYLSQPDTEQVVRISVDAWIKTIFYQFSHDVLSITLIIVALLGMYILYRERHRLNALKVHYFVIMLVEAFIYAFFLALIISQTVGFLLQIQAESPAESLSTLQQLALSLGAGLYEELFFRVILVSFLIFVFSKFFQNRWVAKTTGVLLAAAIFSLVHYVGAFGDPFTLGSFLFRFLFGLALNAIYVLRGFGMAAWTHAIYDLMVVAYLS